MSQHYDVIIIGGGNAGFAAAAKARTAGRTVAFVESADFGGTCPNRGCTPKKVLVAAAHALHEIELAPTHGIEVREARIDWKALIERERAMIAHIPEAMAGVAEKRGDVYRGEARFVGPRTIEVDDRRLEGTDIVIATGSIPRPLPIEGAGHLVTSDDILSDPQQPASVVFIGGGVIAFEFGHVYRRAGTAVTVLEVLDDVLPRMDRDAVGQMLEESARIGINVHTGVSVDRIRIEDGLFVVDYAENGQRRTVAVDRVINGAGRIPNVAHLDLAAADVRHDEGRIDVDEFLRSRSNPHVWVAGDALAYTPQLSPVATYEGEIVGTNIVDGPSVQPDYAIVPSAVYTVPAMASVGLTEAEASQRGIDVDVRVNDMRDWFSGQSYAESVAWSKVLVDRANGQVVGAHLVGHRGEDLIHLFALAMRHGLRAQDLNTELYAFPTFASDIKNLV